jgi:hypothetical protein
MSKRVSGPPRRPRKPVARAVRTPRYRQRVVEDKRFGKGKPARSELGREVEQLEQRDEDRPEQED